MDRLMVLLLLLWSSGLPTEGEDSEETVRLSGGSTRCSGILEVNVGKWERVYHSGWTLKDAAIACSELDCGFAVSLEWRYEAERSSMVEIRPECIQSGSALKDCARQFDESYIFLGLLCSDSVRLVNGASLCSGRLEVKSHQSNQTWSSVCEDDVDLQDAEVVCRELGCGAPSVLKGALYGEAKGPMWTKEFQCGGHESGLLDCGSLDSARNTCSPGEAVGLTCSEPIRLVGPSRCAGTLEVKHEADWRPVFHHKDDWDPRRSAAVCRELKCGAPVSVERRTEPSDRFLWMIVSKCSMFGSSLRECAQSVYNSSILDLTCSEPLWLSGGSSRCAGTLEVNHDEDWRPVSDYDSRWTLKEAAVACGELDCGSAVSVGRRNESSDNPVWTIGFDCVQSGSVLNECVESSNSSSILDLICSGLLLLPNISVSSSKDGVSKAQQQGFQVSKGSTFNISCSVLPQYLGGSFHLTFTSSSTTRNYTQPAVNHSAHFLFPAAKRAHQGSYSCVYHLQEFSHDVSFESRALAVTVSDPTILIIALVLLFLTLLLVSTALFFYRKAGGGQKLCSQGNTALDCCVPAAGRVCCLPGAGKCCCAPGDGGVCCVPGAGKCCCAPGDGKCCCAPGASKCCCAPGASKCCCAPGDGKRCCAPGDGKCCCAPGAGGVCCVPGDSKCCCTPGDGKCCCAPGAGKCCCAPGAGKCCCAPGAGGVCCVPGASKCCCAPGAGKCCCVPGAGRVCCAPGAGRVCCAPGAGRVCCVPGAGKCCCARDAGKCCCVPGAGSVCCAPGAGKCCCAPGAGKCCCAPGASKCCCTPGAGRVCCVPAAGRKPAELDGAQGAV